MESNTRDKANSSSSVTSSGEVVSASGHHVLPRGGFFELVAAPHYFCELIGFTGYALLNSTLPAVLFLVGSWGALVPRALETHQRYLGEFPEHYPALGRRALVPWVF